MLDSLHYDDFAPHVHETLRVRAGASEFEAELFAVADKSPGPKQEMFVVTLRAPLTVPPEQGLYHLEHATLGAGELFLVPIHRDANGLYLEAVFNRAR